MIQTRSTRVQETTQQQVWERDMDAALRLLGSAEPPAELPSRIIATCMEARIATGSVKGHSGWHFFRVPKLAIAGATAVLVGVVIVAGSVEHSRNAAMPTAGMQFAGATSSEPGTTRSSGLGTASAAHRAAQPVKAVHHGRARPLRRANHGRASVTRQVRKPAGVAVPDAPGIQR